ncbi:MAG: DUF4290 domain-containing protein [Cytophagales bacterium]|nr:DUF4290 domain-containing protein [Cytophagales bacterium]
MNKISEYNTERPKLILKEYGRNIQKIVNYLLTVEDKEKRTELAHVLVGLMKQISPAQKESPEYAQRLWDDLFIMSDFKLDINSPFPMPEPEILQKKPDRLAYNKERVYFKHYGKNTQLMVDVAVREEDPERQLAAVGFIGKMMKTFYSAWNKDNPEDQVIFENIQQLAKGKLPITFEQIKELNLFEMQRERNYSRNTSKEATGRKRPGGGNAGSKRKKNY